MIAQLAHLLVNSSRVTDRHVFLLQRVQPAMVGLIDGSLSTLAPIFAVALASHDMQLVNNICNKVVWLEHGVIKQSGSAKEVTAAYLNASSNWPI